MPQLACASARTCPSLRKLLLSSADQLACASARPCNSSRLRLLGNAAACVCICSSMPQLSTASVACASARPCNTCASFCSRVLISLRVHLPPVPQLSCASAWKCCGLEVLISLRVHLLSTASARTCPSLRVHLLVHAPALVCVCIKVSKSTTWIHSVQEVVTYSCWISRPGQASEKV